MQTKIKIHLLIGMLFIIGIIYSCGTPASNFFILTPIDDFDQSQSVDDSNISVGIGSIEFPDYLNKPQIVTYSENNKIIFDEYNRWAEPLEDNFNRVFVENISVLIPTNNIYLFMWPKEDPNIFQVTIKIAQFGLTNDSTVILEARWSVSGSNKKSLLLTEKSSYHEKITNLDYNHIVAAMSKLTGDLCKDIAAEVKERASKN